MNERNEELYVNLQVAQKIIHSITALDKELAKIQAGYQKTNEKYQKIWKTGSPFFAKLCLVFLISWMLYSVLYGISYKYFTLYVVKRTFLEQKVYFPFFIIFAMAISYAIVMLIQLFHNKSVFRANDRRAHQNVGIITRNYELRQREEQIKVQMSGLRGQYAEKCSGWYPPGNACDSDVDYLLQVVGTGEAKNMADACSMLKEQQRYDENMRLKKENLNEQKRHNKQQETNQIADTVVRGASAMAMASAVNNQADATRNQNIHVTHTHY